MKRNKQLAAWAKDRFMKNHPVLAGDPVEIGFLWEQYEWSLTTWALRNDAPGRTAIRAGVPALAQPVYHEFYGYVRVYTAYLPLRD